MELSSLFETTKTAFAHFQASGKRFNYPKELKDDALKLLTHYSESTLCAALGVSHVSLRNWRKDKKQPTHSSSRFLTLDFDEGALATPKGLDDTISLTVNLPHPLSLSLPEQSVKKAVQFICALMKEFER